MKKFSDFLINNVVVNEGKLSIDDKNPVIQLIVNAAIKGKVYKPGIDSYEVVTFKEDKPSVDGSFLTAAVSVYKLQQSFSFKINFFANNVNVVSSSGILNLVVSMRGDKLESKKSLAATWNDIAAGTKTNIYM